jgi:beta-glucuronidase
MKIVRLFVLLTLSLFVVQIIAEEQIISVYNRDKTSLNGNWKIIIDPYDNGYYTFHLDKSTKGYFLDYEPAPDERAVEHEFSDAHTLFVPGDWNTQRDELFFYEGSIWYRNDFEYEKKNGKRTFLYFGAANYKAIVYLNGEELGSHEGGFTPFNIEVTDKIKDGANYLIVKVDNYRLKDRVPTIMTDWWNYGGLTRDVLLIETPGSYIRDYFIQLKKNSIEQVEGWVQLDGNNSKEEITIEIPELDFSISAETNSNGKVEFQFTESFKLWSPENPKLYDIVIKSQNDKVVDKIGFRSITTEGERILLNGNEVYLRGISIHEVAPQRAGRAYSEEDAELLLQWAEELGCNYVRLAHYTHNEHMIRKADEMGLMVWAEVPVYWAIDYENEETYQVAKQQLTEMIVRDKNRSSIVLWSLANETPVIEVRNKFLTKLVDEIKVIDDTRLLTAALRIVFKDNVLKIDDPLGKVIDVLGVNEYIGWYEGEPPVAREIEWVSDYNKPALVSEFGAGALYGLRGEKTDRWTEDYQAFVYEEQIEMLRNVEFVVGMSPWILTDFLSPRRPLYGIQDWFNRKGLISNRGERKEAFYVLQNYYNEKKVN